MERPGRQQRWGLPSARRRNATYERRPMIQNSPALSPQSPVFTSTEA